MRWIRMCMLLGGLVIMSWLTTACGGAAPPAAPQGLSTDTEKNTEGRIVIYWQPHPEETVTWYRLYRDTREDGDFTERVYEGSELQFIDTNVLPGGQYEKDFFYKISAVRKIPGQQEIEGEKSRVISAKTKDFEVPVAVDSSSLNIRAQNLAGDTPGITITWGPNAEHDIQGYYVFRADGADVRPVANDPNAAISRLIQQERNKEILFFKDTAAEVGKNYTYTVVAVDFNNNLGNAPGALRVSDVLLSEVQLLGPADNATVAQSSLNFEWSGVDGAAAYVVIVRNAAGDEVWRSGVTTDTKVPYGGPSLDPTRSYQWLVNAYSTQPNDNKQETNSNSRAQTFRVN